MMRAVKRISAGKLMALIVPLVFVVAIAASPPDRIRWESERHACDRLAPQYQAETEVRLADGCRVDLLSDTEAIEVDFAAKWAEAIGQSLYYAIETGRQPAIVLLTRRDRDERFVERCRKVCAVYGIVLYAEPARPLREPTLAPGPEPYTPTVAIGPATHRPGDTPPLAAGPFQRAPAVEGRRSHRGM